jgi:EAL domain-containing protein (putative c-di-GMP-specific phosphodiesterase class I)
MQGMDRLAAKTEDAQLAERLERIRRVLDGDALSMAFQPIFDLRDGAVIGAEALARFTLEPARGPDAWFADAASVGLGIELEMVAVRAALAGLDQLPPHLFLPINASPGTVGAPQFVEAISEADASRVVVEVSELAIASAGSELSGALGRLRQIGVRFALDDVGRHSNPNGVGDLMALEPEFVKLDIALCRNVHLDTDRQDRVREVIESTAGGRATLIGEGLQARGEIEALRRMGVQHGQGFFLALPGRLPLGDMSDVGRRLTGAGALG